MRHFTSTFIVLLIAFSSLGKTITVNQKTWLIDGLKHRILPGDTITLLAGHYSSIKFRWLLGTKEQPITIINKGGLVLIGRKNSHYAISMEGCQHIHVTGTGDPNIKYGIHLDSTKFGGSLFYCSGIAQGIEIDHLELSRSGSSGFSIKSSPDCDEKYTRDKYTFRGLYIHHNYIHETVNEGMYIGHFTYTPYKLTCNNKEKKVLAHAIRDVYIYQNIIENTGWDAIQVSCADSACFIYDNKITGYGIEDKWGQNSGIAIQSGTTGECFRNYISKGSGNGITLLGLGNNLIYHNIIADAGKLGKTKGHGIFCDDRSTQVHSSFTFIGNIFISPNGNAIRYYSLESENSKAESNLLLFPSEVFLESSPYFAFRNKTKPNIQLNHNEFASSNNQQNIQEWINATPAFEQLHVNTSYPPRNNAPKIEAIQAMIIPSKQVEERTFPIKFDIGLTSMISNEEINSSSLDKGVYIKELLHKENKYYILFQQ